MRTSCSLAALLLLSTCTVSSLAIESPSEEVKKLQESLQTWQRVKKECGGNYSYKVNWSSFTGFGHETEIVVRDNKVSERRFRAFGGEAVAVAPVPVAPPAPTVVARKWTDATGDYSVQAKFVDVRDGTVRLKKQDGKTISVPLDKLSKADQDYVKSLDRPAPPPAKPEGKTWTETGEELGSHKEGAPPKTLDELYEEAQAIVETELQPHHRRYVRFDKQGLLLSCFYVDTRIMDDAPQTGVAVTSIDVVPPASDVDPVPDTRPAVTEPETSPPAVEEKVEIELRNAEGEPGLKRLNQHTHIFSYSSDQTWLQLSFDRVPFTDENVLKACSGSFKYCNVEIRFPERTTETSRVYAQLRGPLRTLDKAQGFTNMKDVKLTFTGFEDGRLKGTVGGVITRLTTRTEGPGLRTDDIAGVGHVDNDANIPFEVNFDLSID